MVAPSILMFLGFIHILIRDMLTLRHPISAVWSTVISAAIISYYGRIRFFSSAMLTL
jgi:hypothetical protein